MKSYHMTIVVSATQAAEVLAMGVECLSFTQSPGQVAQATKTATPKVKVATKTKTTTKAKTKATQTTQARKGRHASMNDVTMDFFTSRPLQVVRAKELTSVLRRNRFKSSGYSAIAALLKARADAPIRKVGSGMYQLIRTVNVPSVEHAQ